MSFLLSTVFFSQRYLTIISSMCSVHMHQINQVYYVYGVCHNMYVYRYVGDTTQHSTTDTLLIINKAVYKIY